MVFTREVLREVLLTIMIDGKIDSLIACKCVKKKKNDRHGYMTVSERIT